MRLGWFNVNVQEVLAATRWVREWRFMQIDWCARSLTGS
jgi:hypothetical protein